MRARSPRDRFVLGSMKFVGADLGYFWLVADSDHFVRGQLDDCGFSPSVETGLAAMRAAPKVSGTSVRLQHWSLADGYYTAIWLGVKYVLPGQVAPEDRVYEAERMRALGQSPPAGVVQRSRRAACGRGTPQERP